MTIYRDLEIGEQILPGDRILVNNKWLEINQDKCFGIKAMIGLKI